MCPSLHEMFPWSLTFLKRSLVFPIALFSPISLHFHLGRLSYLSLCSLKLCFQMDISFLSYFAHCFSSFLSDLYGLLSPPVCLFVFHSLIHSSLFHLGMIIHDWNFQALAFFSVCFSDNFICHFTLLEWLVFRKRVRIYKAAI